MGEVGGDGDVGRDLPFPFYMGGKPEDQVAFRGGKGTGVANISFKKLEITIVRQICFLSTVIVGNACSPIGGFRSSCFHRRPF